MTITKERLRSLRLQHEAVAVGLDRRRINELLDACEALLEEREGLLSREDERLIHRVSYRRGFEACREKAALAIVDLKYETIRRDPPTLIGRAMDLIRGLTPESDE